MSSQEYTINPYVDVGAPVTAVDRFYGRQDLVKEIVYTFTRTRQNAIVLHGQRRIGKTSLLYRLHQDEILRQDYLPIFFELQKVQGSSPGHVLVGLARTIIRKLNLSMTLPDEASLTADYHLFQHVILPQIYDNLEQQRLLILCDEFDAIESSDKSNHPSTEALLGYLQTLVEAERQRLAFVFTVGPRLDLLSEGYQRLFKGVQAKRVGRLEEKDTCNLLTERGREGSLSYTNEALAEIWVLTSGHPYLTQLIGSEIFNRLQETESRQATVADVTACLDKAMEYGHGGLGWFWKDLNRGERLILTTVADRTDRQKSTTDAEIDNTLQQHLLFLTENDRREAYQQLLEGDFLREVERRRYQFAVEFIRLWILKNHSLKEARRDEEQRSNPEARVQYHLGQKAFEEGRFTDAIRHYEQAIHHDPQFVDALMALPPLLRESEVQKAIDLYERAYKLDPLRARNRLIELRLDYTRQLMETNTGDEGILEQAWRMLQINPDHAEARELISRIYLRQIDTHLVEENPAAALSLVQELAEPVPIIQEVNVAQQVREKWLNYSQKQIQHEPPRWEEAQAALKSLKPEILFNETVLAKYNEITLSKATAYLKKGKLDFTLAILKDELIHPLPTAEIKNLLLGYSYRQTERQNWEQADQALIGLNELIDEVESRAAQQALFHRWGDARLANQAFDEAVTIYTRADSPDFKPKIANAYLNKAKWSLGQHQLAEAENSYRQALAEEDTAALRERARNDLKGHFDSFRQSRLWPQAASALKILADLKLVGSDEPLWQADLKMDQADDELERGHLDTAFQLMAQLNSESKPRIKALVRTHARKKAQKGDWKTGEIVLERLQHLLAKDRETSHWYANWLFLRAKALFREDRLDQELVEAKALCQKILSFAPPKTPELDLLASAESPQEKSSSLAPHVCALAADIGLVQAQTYLNQNNLDEAVKLFEEALQLPVPPENLAAEIQRKLQAFSETQWLKENRDLAQRALKAISDLKIGGQEISELLTSQDIELVQRSFKGDQLEEAFAILTNNLITLPKADRQQVKARIYQFSRLYAGRERWDKAKQTLQGLWKWLVPAEDGQDIIQALDVLNWEWLDFTRGKHLAARPLATSQEEQEEIERQIENLVSEIQVISIGGYEDAKSPEFKLDTLDIWAEELIKANLNLGKAYLADNNLDEATQAFRRTLNIDCQRIDPKDDISRSLRNYSERMLYHQNWDEAGSALEHLNSLNLPAPDGRTQPDPRIDGGIQRVILAHARALLEQDEVDNTFDRLQTLPDPWPEGEVKQIILNYSYKRRGSQKEWPQAILALEQLDNFLASGRERSRDQQALKELVDGLEQYGLFLKEAGKLTSAAEIYYQGWECTRDEAIPRSSKLAAYYSDVELEIAQVYLAEDPLTVDEPPLIAQAIQCYKNVLGLPEHTPDHEAKINEALRGHVFEKLVKARKWGRARQLLNYLGDFYPSPSEDYKTLFATWRRDLTLAEVRTELGEPQLEAAFAALTRLKDWLNEHSAPKVTWRDTEELVKTLVYDDFCQNWLRDEAWQLVMSALDSLDYLIPNDSQIIGWQVDGLCLWGRALQKQKNLEGAISQYQQALEKAPNQQAVAIEQIESYLLGSQLAFAKQYLDQDKLDEAVTIYKEALLKPADYLNRADEIRRALKRYSDDLGRRVPTDWKMAHQSLEYLLDLNLNNEEVSQWRQNLILQEAKAKLLGQDDLEAISSGLAALTTLERLLPLGDIQTIVHQYVQERAETEKWQLAVKALDILGKGVCEDAPGRQWVVEELTALGKLLNKQDNLEGGRMALKLALEFDTMG